MVDVPELDETESAVDPFQVCHRGVADQVHLCELQQLGLAPAEQDVQRDHHDGVVRHDEGTIARRGLEVAEERAEPERDIGPRLAAGWAVVELAEVPPSRELAGEPGLHPGVRQQVEHAEFPIPQPLVGEDHPIAVLVAERAGERPSRPRVRRAPQRVELGESRPQPVAERPRLLETRRRELDVGVADVERDHLEALGLRSRGHHVARTLGMPREPQFPHHPSSVLE